MVRNPGVRSRRALVMSVLPMLLAVASCGSPRITFIYPDEAVNMSLMSSRTPTLYIDSVTDMRPPVQRNGQGHFLHVTFPRDSSWEVPATRIYAEALAQDLEQIDLMELVPLAAEADYRLAVDLLSFTCELERSGTSYLVTGLIGGVAGGLLGGGGSHSVKLGVAMALGGMMAIPVPTNHRAEAEVRMTLRDRTGDIVWQKACLGEVVDRSFITPTARPDQQLVNRNLTRAVKRANGCLIGQLRQALSERAAPTEENQG